MNSATRSSLGESVARRAKRGVAFTMLQYGGGQSLRFATNLILARLLFPEAFGTMALVHVFLIGLNLFSDAGVETSIVQNAKGDDESFLNTAWTVNVIRGILLWILTLALAGPYARLYGEPTLAPLLYFTSSVLIIESFRPTAMYTVHRHIDFGRFTIINLVSQVVEILVIVTLAYVLRSVWALAIGSVFSACLRLSAYYMFLPGASNRFHWDKDAFSELFHFGKFIFLSTISTFSLTQGDRAILGVFVPLSTLGVFGIALALAQMPMSLADAIQSRVVFPLYRLKPINESEANRNSLFRARRLVAAGAIALLVVASLLGPFLIELLYDRRYLAAGPIVTLVALSSVSIITLNASSAALLGMGDSKRHFVIVFVTAIAQIGLLLAGVHFLGVIGAALAPGLAVICSYPLRYRAMQHYNAWDPLQDFGLTFLGLLLCGLACIFHWERILTLLP